ncbi:hypothetical protein NDU88_004742 [Pleurodeles waltl]|uniref:Uncharacterized protein n=1 Tax=Pleurodeles waltl TaxID=8319 RepID=A0AAV7WB90_PLEWA|nr:hypothetical protein NDU88_004742 [Pleurodeles waltl]
MSSAEHSPLPDLCGVEKKERSGLRRKPEKKDKNVEEKGKEKTHARTEIRKTEGSILRLLPSVPLCPGGTSELSPTRKEEDFRVTYNPEGGQNKGEKMSITGMKEENETWTVLERRTGTGSPET